MNKRAIGSEAEQQALRYLCDNGCALVAQNARFAGAEVDLIVRDGAYLVFVEVKYRRGTAFGHPEEAVNARKQQRILRAAKGYLMAHRMSLETPLRFDVVAVEDSEVRWIKDAFSF